MVFTTNKNAKIKVSYYAIVASFEILFGNIEDEEENIAYLFLKSVS